MNKRFLKYSFLTIFTFVLTFFSCKKDNHFSVESLNAPILSVDQLFFNWAQANNGRWLPYSVRIAKANLGEAKATEALSSWASILKSVNSAKAYYRSLIATKTGKNDAELNQFLDSLYIVNYKRINQSMRYQNTMDSLFVSYKRLNMKEIEGSTYLAGADTKKLNSTIKSKLQMFIKSEDPNTQFYNSPDCVPLELTDWFDQHYNNLYTNLQVQLSTNSFSHALAYYHQQAVNLVTDDCSQTLLGDFFLTTMGFKATINPETGNELLLPNSCGEAVDKISEDLMIYYTCLNQEMPEDLMGVLADGDPFETGLANTYVSNYQLDFLDQEAIAEVRAQDLAINSLAGYGCSGAPNMAGNIWWNGVREHWLIQLYYLSTHPAAEREYWIPQTSGNNPLNPGRADIANPQTGDMFEIKPAENLTAMNAGRSEVINYVAKANQYCLNSLNGPSSWRRGINFPTVIIPFSVTQNLQADLEEPGLIGYRRIPFTQSPVFQPVPQSIRDKFATLINRLKAFQNFNYLANAERIIMEYFRQNPDLLGYIKTAAIGAGVGIIVGTLVEDFLTAGLGIADDLPCFIMGYRIIRLGLAFG